MISVPRHFKEGIDKIFDQFTKNTLKGNAAKCHLITSSKTSVEIEVSNITAISEGQVKILGIYMDTNLNFDYDISQLCKKAAKNYMQ